MTRSTLKRRSLQTALMAGLTVIVMKENNVPIVLLIV